MDRSSDIVFDLTMCTMIPFYIYYSMFGFQRIGDLAWAAGDMRARGFLLGGTAGRTTLNGEGLQHEDGHSHLIAFDHPELRLLRSDLLPMRSRSSFATAYAGCISDQEDVYYYLTCTERKLRTSRRCPRAPKKVSSRACTAFGRRRKRRAPFASNFSAQEPFSAKSSPAPICWRKISELSPTCGA